MKKYLKIVVSYLICICFGCLVDISGQNLNDVLEKELTITKELSGDDYEFMAILSIKANNLISNQANVHYTAGQSIKLNKGFKVEVNSHFKADLNRNLIKSAIYNEANNSSFLVVSPNPSKGLFNISLVNSESISHMRVYNSSGMLIYEKLNNTQGQTEINLSDFSSGMYFLKVETSGNVYTKKIMIE